MKNLGRLFKTLNTGRKATAYFTDIVALTRVFGENDRYQEWHFCTIEPADEGYSVHSFKGGKVSNARLGETATLIKSKEPSLEAAHEFAKNHLKAVSEHCESGTNIGQIQHLRGRPPLEKNGYKWASETAIDRVTAKSEHVPAILEPQ